jgi:hypothetical protein
VIGSQEPSLAGPSCRTLARRRRAKRGLTARRLPYVAAGLLWYALAALTRQPPVGSCRSVLLLLEIAPYLALHAVVFVRLGDAALCRHLAAALTCVVLGLSTMYVGSVIGITAGYLLVIASLEPRVAELCALYWTVGKAALRSARWVWDGPPAPRPAS